MKNKKIGLDLDGVIYPFQKVVYDILVSHHFLEMSYKNFWLFARTDGYMQREITDLVNSHDTYLIENISTKTKKQSRNLFLWEMKYFILQPDLSLWNKQQKHGL